LPTIAAHAPTSRTTALLSDPPRGTRAITLHYTPAYASRLNQAERWFALIAQRAIRRGSFRGAGELVRKIDAYVANYNLHRRPFVWTAAADSILAKLQRLCKVLMGRYTKGFI
jgi:hypothetical protein